VCSDYVEGVGEERACKIYLATFLPPLSYVVAPILRIGRGPSASHNASSGCMHERLIVFVSKSMRGWLRNLVLQIAATAHVSLSAL
jgi:hypothetical protein